MGRDRECLERGLTSWGPAVGCYRQLDSLPRRRHCQQQRAFMMRRGSWLCAAARAAMSACVADA